MVAAGVAIVAPTDAGNASESLSKRFETLATVHIEINGVDHQLELQPRVTLLDTLRERLNLTGTKKGCNRGECGACTVLLDGRRVNACLVLAVAADGRKVTTIEGLANGPHLHPVQQAFIDHDAFQCGYCTPGQVCSAVGMLREAGRGWPSHVTADLAADPELTEAEIAERMSGNLCRCGAYVNIVPAVRSAGAAS